METTEKLSDLKASVRALKSDLSLITLLKNQIIFDFAIRDGECYNMLDGLCYDYLAEVKDLLIKYVTKENKWDTFNDINTLTSKHVNIIYKKTKDYVNKKSLFNDLVIRLSLVNVRDAIVLKEMKHQLELSENE